MKNLFLIIFCFLTINLFSQSNLTFNNSMRLGTSNYSKGQTISVSGKVFNTGNRTARGANILFILAKSQKPTENDYLLDAVGNSTFRSVSSRRSTSVTAKTRLPNNIRNGTYYLFPVINPSKNQERTYRDNWQRIKITVGSSNSGNNSSNHQGSGSNSNNNGSATTPTLSTACPCIIYSDRNYSGKAACLKVGRTVARNTSVGDNNVESYKIKSGYTLVMRDGVNFNGTLSSGNRNTSAESKLRNRASSFIVSKRSSSSSGSSGSNNRSAFTFKNVSGTNSDACSKEYNHPSISKGRFGRAWVERVYKTNSGDLAQITMVTCQSYQGMCGTYEIRKDRIDGPVVASAWVPCSGSNGTRSGARVKVTKETRLFAVLLRKSDNKRYFLGEMEICGPSKCPPRMIRNYYSNGGGTNGGSIIASPGKKGVTSSGIQVGITSPKGPRSNRGLINTTFEIRNYSRQEIPARQLKVEYYASSDANYSRGDRLILTDNRIDRIKGGRTHVMYQAISERALSLSDKYILAVVKEGSKVLSIYFAAK